jgi:hypothetical protein
MVSPYSVIDPWALILPFVHPRALLYPLVQWLALGLYVEPLLPVPTSPVCPPASLAVGVCMNSKAGESLSETVDGPMEYFI